MRVIKRKIPARESVVYKCTKCKIGGRYRSKIEALACERKPVDPKLFKIGENVTWRSWWHCTGKKTRKWTGRVVDIIGPQVFKDRDSYHGKTIDTHVYGYEVKWECRKCRTIHEFIFHGNNELKKLKTRG